MLKKFFHQPVPILKWKYFSIYHQTGEIIAYYIYTLINAALSDLYLKCDYQEPK